MSEQHQTTDIVAWLKMHKPPGPLGKRMADAAAEIDRLRGEVRQLGRMADTCTFLALGEVCDGCRCERMAQEDAKP